MFSYLKPLCIYTDRRAKLRGDSSFSSVLQSQLLYGGVEQRVFAMKRRRKAKRYAQLTGNQHYRTFNNILRAGHELTGINQAKWLEMTEYTEGFYYHLVCNHKFIHCIIMRTTMLCRNFFSSLLMSFNKLALYINWFIIKNCCRAV